MGYLGKKDIEILKTYKPENIKNMYHCIFTYFKEAGLNEMELSSVSTAYNDNIVLNDQSYAKEIRIVSSGNEPKIYGYVIDNNNNTLYVAGLLDTSPEAYAQIAKFTGFFLEKFNLYIDINFNFKWS